MKRHRAAALLRWLVSIAVIAAAAFFGSKLVLDWLRPQVMVTRVIEGPVIQAFYATGTLLPDREYPIKANAPGYLSQVLVDKGDMVNKDQPLAVVLEDNTQFKFDQAKAERDQAARLSEESTSPVFKDYDARIAGTAEQLEIARREQNRIADALRTNAASPSDLDKALDRVRMLNSELEGLKAQRATKMLDLRKSLEVADAALKIAQWNLDRQTIRSPIDHGVVLDRPATVGTRLAVNDRIMQVADVRPEKLVMRAAVDEEDKTQVHLSQLVHMTLYSFPGRIFEGRVKKIYDKAEPDRRTFEVDITMDEKNPSFSAGMTGELAFIIDHKDVAKVIPSQAVQSNVVWVVRDGQLARSEAQLGLRSVERTEVLSGLAPNEQVVISPIDKMAAGQRVRVEMMDPKEAAALNKPKEEGSPFRGFH